MESVKYLILVVQTEKSVSLSMLKRAKQLWNKISLLLTTLGFISFASKVNVELDLQSLFGLLVHSCTHWLRPRPTPPPHPPPSPPWPHLGSYTRALMVSQDRQRLFVTPWFLSLHTWGPRFHQPHAAVKSKPIPMMEITNAGNNFAGNSSFCADFERRRVPRAAGSHHRQYLYGRRGPALLQNTTKVTRNTRYLASMDTFWNR